MTSFKRRGLQIDDPLGPGGADQSQPAPPAASEPKPPPRPRRSAKAPATRPESSGGAKLAAPANDGQWRDWSGLTGVGSFRLPHELLTELSDTARELGLPVGLMVTAAITQLLDQPEEIAGLVDRADDARIQGRRRARRPLPTKRSDA